MICRPVDFPGQIIIYSLTDHHKSLYLRHDKHIRIRIEGVERNIGGEYLF